MFFKLSVSLIILLIISSIQVAIATDNPSSAEVPSPPPSALRESPSRQGDDLGSLDPKDDKALVKDFFDESYYYGIYREEIEKSSLSALDHFMEIGMEGRLKTEPMV